MAVPSSVHGLVSALPGYLQDHRFNSFYRCFRVPGDASKQGEVYFHGDDLLEPHLEVGKQ